MYTGVECIVGSEQMYTCMYMQTHNARTHTHAQTPRVRTHMRTHHAHTPHTDYNNFICVHKHIHGPDAHIFNNR